MNAVQAECAVHVADLAWLKKSQLTAANDNQIRDGLAPTTNAVQGMATRTNILVPHLHFEGRKRGGHEVELSDGTNKLAERSVLEKAVHHEHGHEVGEDQPGCPPGRGPQIEQLIGKEEQHEEDDRKPLVAQRPRPVEPRLEEAPRRLTH